MPQYLLDILFFLSGALITGLFVYLFFKRNAQNLIDTNEYNKILSENFDYKNKLDNLSIENAGYKARLDETKKNLEDFREDLKHSVQKSQESEQKVARLEAEKTSINEKLAEQKDYFEKLQNKFGGGGV